MIRECVRDGARTTDDVGDACGAGTGCGGCRPTIESILQREHAGADGVPARELVVLTGKAA
jgi:NAD(P)H-nitrite reductase large subunit